jgi:PTS system mannitol-specific IIA component
LLKRGDVSNDFASALIASTEKHGAYYVIMPYLALAHTELGKGTFNSAASLIIFKKPVIFFDKSQNALPVKILFTLASKNADDHLSFLQKIANVFDDEINIKKLSDSFDENTARKILIE